MPAMHRCKTFGVTTDGHQVNLFTLASPSVEVDITDYGATIVAIRCLDRYGRMDDIVAGFPNVEGYELSAASCKHEHGDASSDHTRKPCHFNKVIFNAETNGNKSIKFEASVTRDDGKAGKVSLTVKYDLRGTELHVKYMATSDHEAAIYLGNRIYFNLSGKNERRDLRNHIITLHSDIYMKSADDQPKPVKNTPLDLRKPTLLTRGVASSMRDVFDGGTLYGFAKANTRKSVAKIEQVEQGRIMMIDTTRSLVNVNTTDRCTTTHTRNGQPNEPGVYFSVMPTSPCDSPPKISEYPVFSLNKEDMQSYSVWYSFTHAL